MESCFCRDPLTLAVLQLRENGELDRLKKKWWYENSQCDQDTEKVKDGNTKVTFTRLHLIEVLFVFFQTYINISLTYDICTSSIIIKQGFVTSRADARKCCRDLLHFVLWINTICSHSSHRISVQIRCGFQKSKGMLS